VIRRAGLLAAIYAVLLAVACRPDARSRTDGDIWADGDLDADADVDDTGDTGWDPDCVEAAEWVYLVDADYSLIKFEPDSLRLTVIGSLECPGAGMGTPFSMSVDRNGIAWVLYNGGRIYHVSTTDASCESTTFTPNQAGFELFGMGFVSDEEGSDAETLYIAGGSSVSIGSGSSTLGTIDARLAVTAIANLPGWPELTGTGEGELWGFFPDTVPPSVRQIDKATGATPIVFDLDPMGSVEAQAWAFAAWGGRYYVFLQRLEDESTHVWRLDPDTGNVEDILPDIGYRIVGAGVSTCAPYVLI
jgi:hypothetical protein